MNAHVQVSKENAAWLGDRRGVETTYENHFSATNIGTTASSASPDRCQCCGQALPDRPLGMDRDEMVRADTLGMGPATHSLLAGALLAGRRSTTSSTLSGSRPNRCRSFAATCRRGRGRRQRSGGPRDGERCQQRANGRGLLPHQR